MHCVMHSNFCELKHVTHNLQQIIESLQLLSATQAMMNGQQFSLLTFIMIGIGRYFLPLRVS